MRRRALLAASTASEEKPINILYLYPEIDIRNNLQMTFDFSYIPTSDIYITLETTGFEGTVTPPFFSGIKNGEKVDVDMGCDTSYIKVIDYSPMEDDNFVYQIEII